MRCSGGGGITERKKLAVERKKLAIERMMALERTVALEGGDWKDESREHRRKTRVAAAGKTRVVTARKMRVAVGMRMIVSSKFCKILRRREGSD